MQTPILWSHGIADQTVLFEAGQAGPPFLEQAGVSCEFKVNNAALLKSPLGLYATPKHFLDASKFAGLSWSWAFNKQR